MTDKLVPDLGAWLVLRRVQWDGVILDEGDGAVYDHGQRLPGRVAALVPQLAERGYVWLDDPATELPPGRRVHLTMWGERLFELLDYLAGPAPHPALPRRQADLDTLSLMLDASTILFGP